MLSMFKILTLLTTATCLIIIGLCAPTPTRNGEATFFKPGMGNCGAHSSENDFIVALSTQEYGDGGHCWQHVNISYQGKTIDATVVDSCPGCGLDDLDLSPAAFRALAPISAGRIKVSWNYK